MAQEPVKLPNIRGKLPVVNKLAYELRYHHGHTYLDRCGRILTLIERDMPQWLAEAGQVNPQGASLVNVETGAVFRFSSFSLSLTWEQARDDDELMEDDLKAFFANAEMLSALVVDELGVQTEQLARIGFRVWHLFAARTHDEAEQWLGSLFRCDLADRLRQTVSAQVDSVSLAVVLKAEDRCFRYGFSSGERNSRLELGSRTISYLPRTLSRGQRTSFASSQEKADARKRRRQTDPFVSIIDIDAYQEDPLVLDVFRFLESSWAGGYAGLRQAFV
jgi:hypothetical protein